MESKYITHNFAPVFDSYSRILMLGTMPSPKSRESGFYYGHPRNRFWKVISDICGSPLPLTKEEKTVFLLSRHIALWDVLAGCEICGADDSSIRSPKPNDLDIILSHADIQAIFATGTKAHQLYQKYCYPKTGIKAILLPSTSPANCRLSYEKLREAYSAVSEYLDVPGL